MMMVGEGGLFAGWLLNGHAKVSQGRIYLDNFTCCHTEIEVADRKVMMMVGEGGLFAGWLLNGHASVSQGRIYLDNFTCCHTEIEVADQIFHLIQSQYTDTGPTSPRTDPMLPGAW